MGQLNAGIVPVTPFQQNCTILFDTETRPAWWSIRAATSTDPRRAIRDNGIAVSQIWITHGHIDHAGGAMELKDALGVEIVGPHEADRSLLANLESQAKRFGAGRRGAQLHARPLPHRRRDRLLRRACVRGAALPRPCAGPCRLLQPRPPNSRMSATCCSAARSAAPTCRAATMRADPLDQGKAAAARRRYRLHLRPRPGQPLRRRAARQSVPGVSVRKGAAIAGGALRGQGRIGVSSPRRNVPRRHSR